MPVARSLSYPLRSVLGSKQAAYASARDPDSRTFGIASQHADSSIGTVLVLMLDGSCQNSPPISATQASPAPTGIWKRYPNFSSLLPTVFRTARSAAANEHIQFPVADSALLH